MPKRTPGRRTILLFGARGQLGSELAQALSLLGTVVEADRSHCDLADGAALHAFITEQRPNLLVNSAAYTAVDEAESKSELATAVNSTAPRIMAEKAAHFGIPLVHYSTDYVYDGTASEPYREDQPTAPRSVYGRTKLAGDRAIAASGCAHLIFRTTWVYGHEGNNFVRTILRLAQTRESLDIVADQYGAPTWSRLLAEATALAIARADALGWTQVSGVYHMSAGGSTHWCDYARLIVTLAQEQGLLSSSPTALMKPISTAAYGAPAARPANSVLDNRKLAEVFGFILPDWRTSLRQFMRDPGSQSLVNT